MEGFESLLDRCVVVPAVDLVEIDIVGAEASQAAVDFGENGLAGQSLAVGPRTIRPWTLVAMTTSSRETIDSRV